MAVATAVPTERVDHTDRTDRTGELGRELDRIRSEVVAARGADDARYIRRVIAVQRGLETGGRIALAVSLFPPAWCAGTAMLTGAKILENMELGHNVLHGQWDWMGDPAIHSTTWEWDFLTPADAWKHTHNHLHHTYTNVVGLDRDLGYTVLRMSPEQPWRPLHLLQPLYAALLAPVFEWGIAVYDLEADAVTAGRKSVRAFLGDLAGLVGKGVRQAAKDYVLFPLLAGPSALPCLLGNLTANTARNVWAHTIIFCGHFPGDVQTFAEEQLEGESRGQWYQRQIQGSANIEGGFLFHVLTGNLSHQIEHHVFPDLPSNRYAEVAPRVREICARYGLPYVTGPLGRQYGSMWGRVLRHALPPR
ncbi:fatty acid desaturase family protein [Streptomyces sp. MMG1533]|uniref:fatty acid desaturase family protein n=1 Tax=Streptomyces sp. MMG1533 TaxID=1415546 RepID=UPI00099DA657|nr:acyl-CoA desaturase [Streptomyces sp. MMG1533]